MLTYLISILLESFFVLHIIFTIIIIFFERKKPASTWAWIIVVNILPYFGFIIYLFFGLDSHRYKIFNLKYRHDNNIYKKYLNIISQQNCFLYPIYNNNTQDILKIPDYNKFNDIVYMNYKSSGSMVSINNKTNIFYNGEAKFECLLKDIKDAKNFIYVQYYVFREDKLGKKILDALTEKAREGLEVRLLLDGMGCIKNSRKFYYNFKKAGGKVIYFLPPYFFRINFRNHRKICIIDGVISYIGGINVGLEYINKSKKFGFWRDTHIRIYGDATKSLNLRFIMDWNFCNTEKIIIHKKYFPYIKKIGCTTMQIISSGPDTRCPAIQNNYLKIINKAEKFIYIETPYFIPPDSVLEALSIAALSGIDVKIIVPAKADHMFVYWANSYYIGELLKVGIKFYKYKKGFIHSKLLLIDNMITLVGTANMDIRSFRLNFETNAVIYDRYITKNFYKQFCEDLKDCEEIFQSDYDKRSYFVKIRESISKLFSPLL